MAEPNSSSSTMKRDFSRVVLTLDNVVIPSEKLLETPSMQDGLDKDIEVDLRILGCELIQTAGILLKLPQVAMATAQVVFQRFYYSKSFIKHNMEVVAMASIMLASKIEECPRRNRDVINVFHHIKQVRNERNIHPLPLDQHYINLKNQVIKGERRILKELGFCVHVKHPHKYLFMYCKVLDMIKRKHFVQTAWNFMNDSLRSDVFMRYNPESIACACLYLAARQEKIVLPSNPPWFLMFEVTEDVIQEICLSILRLYARDKPNYGALEKTVEDLKKRQQAAKSKARGIVSDADTPNSSSRQNSPKVVSPNPTSGLLASIKKEKEKKAENELAKRSDNSDHDSHKSQGFEKNYMKKRTRDRSVDSDRSRDSGSSLSHSSNHDRSRSPRSESPTHKKRRHSPGSRKPKKLEAFGKEKHKKNRYRSRSRSRSHSLSPRSPLRVKNSKKSRRDEYKISRDYYKDTVKDHRDKDFYREKDYKDRDYYKEKDHKDRDYYKERDYRERRSYTPEKDRHRSRKNRNGHRDSPIRDKNDKNRR